MSDPREIVTIKYTNWRGETAWRRIRPMSISFANSQWHPSTQWILEAYDMDKREEREFAMADIHSWERRK